jgi:NOL1/NOP2/fmu family ribosome biogenesis protein
MDRPPPDPTKHQAQWMEWERGEATPGRVMANMKTAGLRLLLEDLAAEAPSTADSAVAIDDEAASSWTPTV